MAPVASAISPPLPARGRGGAPSARGPSTLENVSVRERRTSGFAAARGTLARPSSSFVAYGSGAGLPVGDSGDAPAPGVEPLGASPATVTASDLFLETC